MPEVIIYQADDSSEILLPIVHGEREVLPGFLSGIAKALAIIGASILIVTYAPNLWSLAIEAISSKVASVQLSQKEVQLLSAKAKTPTLYQAYLPPLNSSLSPLARLSVPSIGVETNIQEATYSDYEDALKKGVWRVSDFGAPDTQTMPVILAAHRFGYLAWTNEYRRENSFYNLPKIATGDIVTIDWRQREYKYEVYEVSKDTEIKDYTADLILYTCEALTGPERYFVYAKLLKV